MFNRPATGYGPVAGENGENSRTKLQNVVVDSTVLRQCARPIWTRSEPHLSRKCLAQVSLDQDTKARYRMLRDKGMKHNAAIRKLARSWIRILFRVWQTETPFNCDRYIARLKQRCPEITQYLAQEN